MSLPPISMCRAIRAIRMWETDFCIWRRVFFRRPLPRQQAPSARGWRICSGYGIWAPGTVIIKVLTAFCFTNRREKLVNKRNVLGILPALVLCVGGYYLYEALITGNFTAPALGIPGYLTQVALSSVVYLALGSALDRAGIKKKLGEI